MLKENDFLLARSGSVGRAFLYHEDMGKAIFAGYLVRYILDCKKIIPEYMLFYTQTKLFKEWVNNAKHISAQPNINGQEYLLAPIILPPINVQELIVREVYELRKKIQSLRLEAQELLKQAHDSFEEDVFGE